MAQNGNSLSDVYRQYGFFSFGKSIPWRSFKLNRYFSRLALKVRVPG
jgi:hypothetical protein